MTKTPGKHRAETGADNDAALLAAVRAGDTGAYAELYDRHSPAAQRLARVLAPNPSDADDLVAEAFAKVLAALRGGRGPEIAFRPYLLTAVRNARYDRARADRRVELTEDITRYEVGGRTGAGEAADPAVAKLERSYAARAFAKLPERWRMVLWHTEVEGEKPAAIAPLLGLTPNAVAALAYRARERLRQIYLQEHLAATSDPSCHWTADRLGAHVRRGLPGRDRSKVDAHLARCDDCRTLWTELAEVNSGLRGVLAPVVLGGAAVPYLGAATTGTGGLLAGSWVTLVDAARQGWHALAAWVRRLVERYGPGNVAAAGGVAAATVVGLALFAAAIITSPFEDRGEGAEPDPPPAAARPPVPAPQPGPLPTSRPTDPPAPEPEPAPAGQATGHSATPPPPAADPPRPVITPDLTGTALAAGGVGELAIGIRLPAPESTNDSAEPGGAGGELTPREVALALSWPEGMALAGDDAGSGWRCSAPGNGRGAACRRPVWAAGETSTARIPVRVAASLGGLTPVDVAVAIDGSVGSATARLRVPVAPAGMGVAYAGTGPYRMALAGNTWLACAERPGCWREGADNDTVPLVPYRPGGGDPPPPPSSPIPAAALSGADLAVPAGGRVAWAGLWWATTASSGPAVVALHRPGGGWHRLGPDAVTRQGPGRPLWQAYADVTDLVRGAGAGAWWMAASADALPTGYRVSAGWSLTVVYAADPAATGRRDLAVFTGPVSVNPARPLGLTTATTGRARVGLVAWEGDRALAGGELRVGGESLGTDAAAARAEGARECGGVPDCGWHTFGVDAARYAGTGGPLALSTGPDKFEVGVLVLAVDATG